MSTKTKSGIFSLVSLVVILILLVNVWINLTKATVDKNSSNNILVASIKSGNQNNNNSSHQDNSTMRGSSITNDNDTTSTAAINPSQSPSSSVTTDKSATTIVSDQLEAALSDIKLSKGEGGGGSSNSSSNSSGIGSSIGGGERAGSGATAGLCANNTASKNSSSDIDKYFDIVYACKTFEDCMADKDAVPLYNYIAGFKELMKFFNSLGTIFLFVTSDLESKIGILEGYRRLNDNGECNPLYATIKSTVEYETKENLLRDQKRPSGSRTILRLHRALEFLSALMSNLSKLDDESETASAARDAYSMTLAKHHPWAIRTIASFAMRTLPPKKQLVENVIGPVNLNNAVSINDNMLKLANITGNLFALVDKFYEENNIQDLP